MALLKEQETGRLWPVTTRLVVGRSLSCGLVLVDRHVSGEHATLIWTGTEWQIRDLGSRNGTFVDGRRLGAGEAATVSEGTCVGFGHDSQYWEILDAAAPTAVMVSSRTGDVREADNGLLVVPSEQEPLAVLLRDASGRWRLEIGEDAARIVDDGEMLVIAGETWRVHVPDPFLHGTAAVDGGLRLDAISLRFAVSRDEEHVRVTVVHRGKEIELEPREHAYLLLTLARERLTDREEPLAEQGWLERDRLLKMLALESNALNVAIYRMRRQLTTVGIDGAAGVVEVRRGQRRIGVEPERLQVEPM